MRYHAEMMSPPITVKTPNMIAAIHTTRRLPASAQAHSGRWAASSSAHIEMPRGMQANVAVTMAMTQSLGPYRASTTGGYCPAP